MTIPTEDEQSNHQHPIRFLLFSGSLRNDSLNTRLAILAKKAIEKNGGEVDLAKINEFDCPSYNQDLEKQAMPSGAVQLRERLLSCDALIIASPEYSVGTRECQKCD